MSETAEIRTRLEESVDELVGSFIYPVFGEAWINTIDTRREELSNPNTTSLHLAALPSVYSESEAYSMRINEGAATAWRNVISLATMSRLRTSVDLWQHCPDRTQQVATCELQELSVAFLCEYEIGTEAMLQAEKWGIRKQVETALEIIRDTYNSLRDIELSISIDPEIPERKRIRVTLTVSGAPEDVFADEIRFKEWMCSELDAKAGELIAITYRWE